MALVLAEMDSLYADTWRLILIFFNFLASNNKVSYKHSHSFCIGKYQNSSPSVLWHSIQARGINFFSRHVTLAPLFRLASFHDLPPWRNLLYESLSEERLLCTNRDSCHDITHARVIDSCWIEKQCRWTWIYGHADGWDCWHWKDWRNLEWN